MPEIRWGGDDFCYFCYKWEDLVPDLDKLVLMYWGDLLTFEAIGEMTGHS
ncbi:hypothetical protein [Tumebacillus algifaecis]|nr:hypothetical protein [Tumebacillus algifaecis]